MPNPRDQPPADGSSGAPIAHALKQRPIPWPKEHERNRPAPARRTDPRQQQKPQ